MTNEEIFSQIGQHMIKGLMVHTQLSDYYNFLGLDGYCKCHEYHFYEESKNFRHLSNYYIKNYDKFITDSHVGNPQVIPTNWYQYSRNQVDTAIRKTAIQQGFEKWINWETETVELYENLFLELLNLGELSAAFEIEKYLGDTKTELCKAKQKLLELKMTDFDITMIVAEQEAICKKYQKKMEKIKL